MAQIEMLKVKDLLHHPDNPRKAITPESVSELAESMKAKGVLQNLTVIPAGVVDKYFVIIGNRRLEAAKLAGIPELPCVITDQPREEVIETMTCENLHRENLTVREQAECFQLMLSCCGSIEKVAQRTGFSKETVRHRVKLLDLDKDAFEASTERGGLITDYIDLEQLEDAETKNKVLKTVGTANFRNELQKAITKQKEKKVFEAIEKKLSTFAEKIDSSEAGYDYLISYSGSADPDKVEIPADSNVKKYRYKVSDWAIYLYKEADPDKKEKKKTPYETWISESDLKISEMLDRHHALRKEFIKNFSSCTKYADKIASFAARQTIDRGYSYVNTSLIGTLLGIPDNADLDAEIAKKIEEEPVKSLLAAHYSLCDGNRSGFICRVYSRNDPPFQQNENKSLSRLYEFLCSIGYELSDSEKEEQDGTFLKEILSSMPDKNAV